MPRCRCSRRAVSALALLTLLLQGAISPAVAENLPAVMEDLSIPVPNNILRQTAGVEMEELPPPVLSHQDLMQAAVPAMADSTASPKQAATPERRTAAKTPPDFLPAVKDDRTKTVEELPVQEAAKQDKNSTTLPMVSAAPIIMAQPKMLAAAPVAAELSRYQFLPLFAPSSAPDALPLLWPVLSSRPLAADQTQVQRAVIVLHDMARDAADTLERIQPLAGGSARGARAAVLIVAPLFPIKADRAPFKPLLTDATPNIAAWAHEDWWQGADTEAADNRGRAVSSMAALDLLLLLLADTKNFPALREIVIAGYGRGADLAHRYALYGRAPDVLATQKLAVRYVLAAPQSYVYLTDNRPGVSAGSFALPKDSKICPDYQNYPYGLEQPNAYARLTAGNMARQRYAERAVTVLVGAGDTGAAHDQNCGAAWQGKSVKDRATNYQAFLKTSFGDAVKQELLVMPNAGSDALAVLTSGCGASLLFSDGECLLAGAKPAEMR